MGLFSEAWASSGHQFLIKSNPIQLGDFGKVKIDVDFNDRAYAIGIDKANRHSYYISFMVQNLTHSNQGAEVWLNNKKIGEIHGSYYRVVKVNGIFTSWSFRKEVIESKGL